MSIHRTALGGALLMLAMAAAAQPTTLAVHVISRDAKFMGSSVGGVLVTVVEAETGRMLAQGVTEGGTGDTERIMIQPRQRGAALVDAETAGFTATVDLVDPVRVRVTAHGPLDYPGSANTISATHWLIPGGHVQPWILEMPGLLVDLHDVAPLVDRDGGEAEVSLTVTVRMMCACPITPGGTWDSNDFDVRAQLARNGLPVTGATLGYAGETSEFAGSARVTEPGRYDVVVTAYQKSTGNTGIDRTTVVVD